MRRRWAGRRGASVRNDLDVSQGEQPMPGIDDRLLIATTRRKEGRHADDPLCLAPF
jgi:hypothetical protein